MALSPAGQADADLHTQAALLRALRAHDLGALLAALPEGTFSLPDAVVRIHLRRLFAAGAEQGTEFARPGADFYPWAQAILAVNQGGGAAKTNTLRARLSVLSRLYAQLTVLGVTPANPLQGVERPARQAGNRRLPPAPALALLLDGARQATAAGSGPERQFAHALHVVLQLSYRHALHLRGLLRLRWAAYDPADGTLRLPFETVHLGEAGRAALEGLWDSRGRPAGDDLILAGADPDALRAAHYRLCLAAGLTPFELPALRTGGLRDFGPPEKGTQDASVPGHQQAVQAQLDHIVRASRAEDETP